MVSDDRAPAPPPRGPEGPGVPATAAAAGGARARRVAAEMRENLLKRKRQQRALRGREEERG